MGAKFPDRDGDHRDPVFSPCSLVDNVVKKKIWRLCVRDDFSAAHALRNYNGKCERQHGHNFEVELCVEGDALDQANGLLLDFGILKSELRDVLSSLDHQMLNQIPPFDQINPSSENLARHIWQTMEVRLPDNVHLSGVSVSEKGSQTATYMEYQLP